jgi:DNA-binding HxlR family transcriptional regulator
MKSAPRPGRPVRGSRTGRPIMALLDLLGRRWTLRVIWELREGRLTFRALQEACGGVSPTVLNQRLRELRESGLVDAEGEAGYGLTPLGRELVAQTLPLVAWSTRWAAAVTRGRGTPRSSR